jgi:hypothetical protein
MKGGRMAVYEIRVKGHLDGRWSEWFDGLMIANVENGDALLSGEIVDQSALHGVLAKVRDLVILSKPADAGKARVWLKNSYPMNCGTP